MIDITYKIFHLEGYGDSAELRSKLFNRIDSYLYDYFPRLDCPTVLISNEEEYDKFNSSHNLLNPKTGFKWGELGVWASNLLAMENFLKTDHKYLMLMEDDINFEPGLIDNLFRYMKQLPEDWDMFSYFVHPNQFSRFDGDQNESGVVKSYQDWSMLCYLITRKMAEKMLRDTKEGIAEPIDWYMFRHPERYNMYTLAPNAFRPVSLYEISSTFQQKEDRILIDKG